MICKFCGSYIEKGTYCRNCGARQATDEDQQQTMNMQESAQESVFYQDENGAWHWEYLTSTFRDYSVLVRLLRFILGFGVFMALVQLMLWFSNGRSDDIAATLIFVGECTAGVLAFFSVVWVILMLIKGPKITAKYTMDDSKISYTTERYISEKRKEKNHKYYYQPIYNDQTPSKWQRPELEYPKVRKIKAISKKNLIWISIYRQSCPIFVPQDHYEFVLQYISSRCPQAKIKGVKSEE